MRDFYWKEESPGPCKRAWLFLFHFCTAPFHYGESFSFYRLQFRFGYRDRPVYRLKCHERPDYTIRLWAYIQFSRFCISICLECHQVVLIFLQSRQPVLDEFALLVPVQPHLWEDLQQKCSRFTAFYHIPL